MEHFLMQLAEHALWIACAPLIDLEILFPEPKQPFNLPARPLQDEHLIH